MQNSFYYYNGQILPSDSVTINPSDRGFLLSDGLFETIRVVNGAPVFFQKHWDRLRSSCEYLKIKLNYSYDEILEAVKSLIKMNNLNDVDAGVRLTLTRGVAKRGLLPHDANNPTLLITSFEVPAVYKTNKEYKLCIASSRRNEYSILSKIKSLNYLDNILMKEEAVNRGYDDALFF